MTTKLELIRKLPKFIALAHGEYDPHAPIFTVPDDTVYIFVSKASRYLLQSVITPQFYNFFGRADKNYTALNTPNMPNVIKGWNTHTYGPGQRIRDISLQFSDPQWVGMGIHPLPVRDNQFKTTPGLYNGQTGPLSTLKLKGVIFIVACRAVKNQPNFYNNQTANYQFPKNTIQSHILVENNISKSLRKRRESSSSNNSNKMNVNTNNLSENGTNIMFNLLSNTRGLRSSIQENYNSPLIRSAYKRFAAMRKLMGKTIISYPTFQRRLRLRSFE